MIFMTTMAMTDDDADDSDKLITNGINISMFLELVLVRGTVQGLCLPLWIACVQTPLPLGKRITDAPFAIFPEGRRSVHRLFMVFFRRSKQIVITHFLEY